MVLIHKIVSHALQTGGASTPGKTGIELQEQAWERDPEKSPDSLPTSDGYRKAGRRPNNATKVMDDNINTATMTFLTKPIFSRQRSGSSTTVPPSREDRAASACFGSAESEVTPTQPSGNWHRIGLTAPPAQQACPRIEHMAQIVYTGLNDNRAGSGSLFQGQKIWFSQRVPSRSQFIEQVKANGGEVVQLEKFADIKIVDHARKESLPGTHSWKYIDLSIRKGILEDLDKHRVGPPAGTTRDVGSVVQPARGSRTRFTAEDDRVLYDWVEASEDQGSAAAGNVIYQQLEANNPRHTWQSWRDRWVRHLKDRPRPARIPANAPPTPPLEQIAEHKVNLRQHNETKKVKAKAAIFTDEDAKALLAQAGDILNMHPERIDDAWQKWAKEYQQHTAQDWRNFWEQSICPIYLRKQGYRTGVKGEPNGILAPKTHSSLIAQKSPSFRPDSPQRASADQPHLQDDVNRSPAPNDYVLEQSIEPIEVSAALSDLELPPEGRKTPKRKRHMYEPEIPSSSPFKPLVKTTNKRLRPDEVLTKQREIPSTPEKGSTVDVQEEVILRDTGFIDLGSDCLVAEDEDDSKDVDEDDGKDVDENREDEEDITGHQASQSLSEPDHQWMSAKSNLEDYQEEIDFDLPPPEGGWDSDAGNERDVEEFDHPTPRGARVVVEDTQALLNGNIPTLDLTVPDPDEDWGSLVHPPSSPPPLPASDSSQDTPESGAATGDAEVEVLDEEAANLELQKWAEERMAARVPLEDIEIALKSTSNNLDLADVVLESLAQHAGIPQGMMGVWTEEDDADVVAADARKIARLHRKHGEDAFDRRFTFLEIYNEDA
ncbi:MAG: hypothetical protein Q9187_005120 [Circinaria calcarea]